MKIYRVRSEKFARIIGYRCVTNDLVGLVGTRVAQARVLRIIAIFYPAISYSICLEFNWHITASNTGNNLGLLDHYTSLTYLTNLSRAP